MLGETGGTSNKEPWTKLILAEGVLNAIYLSGARLYIWVIFLFYKHKRGCSWNKGQQRM